MTSTYLGNISDYERAIIDHYIFFHSEGIPILYRHITARIIVEALLKELFRKYKLNYYKGLNTQYERVTLLINEKILDQKYQEDLEIVIKAGNAAVHLEFPVSSIFKVRTVLHEFLSWYFLTHYNFMFDILVESIKYMNSTIYSTDEYGLNAKDLHIQLKDIQAVIWKERAYILEFRFNGRIRLNTDEINMRYIKLSREEFIAYFRAKEIHSAKKKCGTGCIINEKI